VKRTAVFGILMSIAGCFVSCVSQPHEPDPSTLLSLPWQQFDQTPNSGWRVYSARREHRAAADLIEAYLKQHPELTVRQRAVSHFHAGQMRVHDGHTPAGLTHMRQALTPDNTPGLSDDWNIMVSAHIAFLTSDRATLVALKEQVAGLLPSRVEWPGCPADLLEHLGEPLGSWKSK